MSVCADRSNFFKKNSLFKHVIYMQHIKVKKNLVVINTAIITDIFNKN